MWWWGIPNPIDYNDNEGFCGGFEHMQSLGGLCGICGDAYDDEPREHEAPDGLFANGIIVAYYQPGQYIDVLVDITTNHLGHFEFCAQTTTWSRIQNKTVLTSK
jgi:hypothetical protein